MNHRHADSQSTHQLCLSIAHDVRLFEPHAEDILTDEDLLDLFRIVKQVLRKKPDSDKLAKLLFCVSYALGDHVKFFKPLHEDKILFREDANAVVNAVRLPSNSSCCGGGEKWMDSTSVSSKSSAASPTSSLSRLLSVSYLTQHQPSSATSSAVTSTASSTNPVPDTMVPAELPSHPLLSSADDTSTDAYTVRPYTNFRPLYFPTTAPSPGRTSMSATTSTHSQPRTPPPVLPQHQHQPHHHLHHLPLPTHPISQERLSQSAFKSPAEMRAPFPPSTDLHLRKTSNGTDEVLMEPKQRGFYYQDGRIAREPVLLQRYAEQGILTQASLMRKRKRQSTDSSMPFEATATPLPTKKPKIPHRHGEFEQRRDDIIARMRSITMADLEQKAQRVANDFTLSIEEAPALPDDLTTVTAEQAAELLDPALKILTTHSNMKPHLDNGMNQNGIYYNTDYFRLYLAFEQFQKTFAALFPNEVVKIADDETSENGERDKDRERNANMKAYRSWIEPLLSETNWAAFRRNIVVGERMMQLTKIVGQGVLLMTKELSGSKLHLTFTNNEWDEFVSGLSSGRWDMTIKWDHAMPTPPPPGSILVNELRQKFNTRFWFYPDGLIVAPKDRKMAIDAAALLATKQEPLQENVTVEQ